MDQPFIVGIRFQKSGKVYHFDASHCNDLQPHDFVVVETARGRQLGEVIGIVANQKSQEGSLKPIQRKATPRDLVLKQIWQCKEVEAITNCRVKARDFGFDDLKFVSAEFSFDGTRLTLLYNSEEGSEKPDLRNLRRAMSRLYPHAQIEMHPMGPRDVAKLLGGLGACGLEERCCSGFLVDFSPISIKMAKEQDISLTPTEITGMCGRLRCCLAYEYEQYVESRKSLPKKNKRVLTPHGEGKVIEVLPLKKAVVVLLDNEVLHEYLAHEIQLFDENGMPQPRVIASFPDQLDDEGYTQLIGQNGGQAGEDWVDLEKPEQIELINQVDQRTVQRQAFTKTSQDETHRGQRQGRRGYNPPSNNLQPAHLKQKPADRQVEKQGNIPESTSKSIKKKKQSNQRRNRGR